MDGREVVGKCNKKKKFIFYLFSKNYIIKYNVFSDICSQKINQQLYTSIEKLIKNYTKEKTSKLLGLTQDQLNWLTQLSDTEDFTNLQELHNLFYKNNWKIVIEITELKLKKAVLLILAYHKKIITF